MSVEDTSYQPRHGISYDVWRATVAGAWGCGEKSLRDKEGENEKTGQWREEGNSTSCSAYEILWYPPCMLDNIQSSTVSHLCQEVRSQDC